MDALQAVLEPSLGAVQLRVRLGEVLELLVELLLDLRELLGLEGVEVDWGAQDDGVSVGRRIASRRGFRSIRTCLAFARHCPRRRRLLPGWRGRRGCGFVPGSEVVDGVCMISSAWWGDLMSGGGQQAKHRRVNETLLQDVCVLETTLD